MKDLILTAIDDLVSDFLYYDRKSDEELSIGAIEKAIKEKLITVEEIVAQFQSQLFNNLKDD